ncbi:MAG: hypothetical protein ABJM39_09575 [Porticoccus sp.]|uniref:hypothetical protein n=1 Tax=Porticoccus sp. TaxID=2024853 RepID=UPI0032997F45
MQWEPIETAPKDGTRIIVWGAYSYTKGKYECGEYEASWNAYEQQWDTPIGPGYGEFTHWRHSEKPDGAPDSMEL